MMDRVKGDWKKYFTRKNTPAKTDGDTTTYKPKGYEEISNAMKCIVALM